MATTANPHFERKKWKFEEKSQVCPNSLVFNLNLSDQAKILLLALNGITSTTPNWQIRQSDIQKRLNWGKERMQKAIKNCIANGYMQTRMIRGKNGKFDHKYFEFDMEPTFSSEKPAFFGHPTPVEESQENTHFSQGKPSHTQCEPLPGLPLTANQPLLTRNINISKENNKQHPESPPQKIANPSPEPVVVVLSSPDQEKLDLLNPYHFDPQTLEKLATFPADRIKTAISALEQRIASKGIANPSGFLRVAIIQGWRPNQLNENSQNNLEQKTDRIRTKTINNIKIANKMIENYIPTEQCKAYISDSVAYLITPSGCFPLDMAEDDSLDILSFYLETNLLKKQ